VNDFYRLTPAEQGGRLERLARAALAHWNITDAALDLLKIRENAVFSVTTPDQRRFAIRIHRAGYHTDDELRSELQWMQALGTAGIDVPELVPERSGELFCNVAHDDVPEARQVDLFRWIEGRQLGSIEQGFGEDPASVHSAFHTLGVLAALVHNQASAWTLPPGFTRHAWDAEGLVGERPFWGRFWELEALSPAERKLMETARARVREGLEGYGRAPDRYSLIHADFSPENIMVDGGRLRLIDFDDAGFGWHLFELATALYFFRDSPHHGLMREGLIAGYRTQRDLPDAELEQLPLFTAARAFTYLGWVHTRSETETARELTPMLIEMACKAAREL
jgi:Ser/Thr protein kinase RdoA (MazF antagonist)